jgi:hypothetical protein
MEFRAHVEAMEGLPARVRELELLLFELAAHLAEDTTGEQ